MFDWFKRDRQESSSDVETSSDAWSRGAPAPACSNPNEISLAEIERMSEVARLEAERERQSQIQMVRQMSSQMMNRQQQQDLSQTLPPFGSAHSTTIKKWQTHLSKMLNQQTSGFYTYKGVQKQPTGNTEMKTSKKSKPSKKRLIVRAPLKRERAKLVELMGGLRIPGLSVPPGTKNAHKFRTDPEVYQVRHMKRKKKEAREKMLAMMDQHSGPDPSGAPPNMLGKRRLAYARGAPFWQDYNEDESRWVKSPSQEAGLITQASKEGWESLPDLLTKFDAKAQAAAQKLLLDIKAGKNLSDILEGMDNNAAEEEAQKPDQSLETETTKTIMAIIERAKSEREEG